MKVASAEPVYPSGPDIQTHRCPIDCPSCDHKERDYPARFSELLLPRGGEIPQVESGLHHMLFLFDGALQVHTGGHTVRVQPGHCVFFVRHTRPQVYAVEPSSLKLLGFSNRVVLGRHDWLAGIATRRRERSRQEAIPTLKLDPMTLNVLLNIMPIPSPCYHVLKQYDLFIHLARSYSEAELARFFHPILRASDDFKAFVTHNYANGDSLEDIAGKAHLSKSYFMRRFKEDFGMTAHQWLVQQKKEEFVRMIAGGQTHTKTMADTLGFSDLAGLYQFCRKHFGCSITGLMERVGQNCAPVGSAGDDVVSDAVQGTIYAVRTGIQDRI
jgi:AraC-like DNA-binding protein